MIMSKRAFYNGNVRGQCNFSSSKCYSLLIRLKTNLKLKRYRKYLLSLSHYFWHKVCNKNLLNRCGRTLLVNDNDFKNKSKISSRGLSSQKYFIPTMPPIRFFRLKTNSQLISNVNKTRLKTNSQLIFNVNKAISFSLQME